MYLEKTGTSIVFEITNNCSQAPYKQGVGVCSDCALVLLDPVINPLPSKDVLEIAAVLFEPETAATIDVCNLSGMEPLEADDDVCFEILKIAHHTPHAPKISLTTSGLPLLARPELLQQLVRYPPYNLTLSIDAGVGLHVSKLNDRYIQLAHELRACGATQNLCIATAYSKTNHQAVISLGQQLIHTLGPQGAFQWSVSPRLIRGNKRLKSQPEVADIKKIGNLLVEKFNAAPVQIVLQANPEDFVALGGKRDAWHWRTVNRVENTNNVFFATGGEDSPSLLLIRRNGLLVSGAEIGLIGLTESKYGHWTPDSLRWLISQEIPRLRDELRDQEKGS